MYIEMSAIFLQTLLKRCFSMNFYEIRSLSLEKGILPAKNTEPADAVFIMKFGSFCYVFFMRFRSISIDSLNIFNKKFPNLNLEFLLKN